MEEEILRIVALMNKLHIAEHPVEFFDLCNPLFTKISCGICRFVQFTNYYNTL